MPVNNIVLTTADINRAVFNDEYQQFAQMYPEMTINPFGTSRVNQEPEKEVNLMPKKMNKLKEWSISARALKRVIAFASTNRCRYDYKFSSIYDEHYKLYRIWNVKTKNVICTVKPMNRKIFIRYRQKSVYSPLMSDLDKTEVKNFKFIAIPSDRLAIRRGNSANALCYCSASKEAQLGLRKSMYKEAMSAKRMAEEAKKQPKKRSSSW